MRSRNEITSSIELRWPVAFWVLGAHAYALLVPLTLIVAVSTHWDYLLATTYNPVLFYVAAGMLCAGSAFEIAQNAIDRWYLTHDSPSANGTGFSDFLFYWLVTAGQALCAVAIGGDVGWVILIAVTAVAIFPFCYIRQIAHFAPLSVSSMLSMWLAYNAFGDPIVFLQLLMAAFTGYFFVALLKTGAQVIHGFTTISASSGVWFFIWAISNGASGASKSWLFTGSIVLAALAGGLMLWPILTRFPTSPRIIRSEISANLASNQAN